MAPGNLPHHRAPGKDGARPLPSCPHCPGVAPLLSWQEDSLGRRHVRATCSRCQRWLGFVPKTAGNSAVADRSSSATDLLNCLTMLDELKIAIHSDGTRVYFTWPDCERVPAELHALVRACSFRLAKLMGDTSKIR
jgi:hypothetical protein